jgi:hypothetical protein
MYVPYMELIIDNKPVVIDEEDFHLLQEHTWHVNSKGYVWTRVNKKTLLLHRLILKASSSDIVDHINHNPSDNRKSNIRLCDKFQNRWNERKRSPDSFSSKFKGVSFSGNEIAWRAIIYFKSKAIHLMTAWSENDCAFAYDTAAKLLHKEFAYLNNIEPDSPKEKIEEYIKGLLQEKKYI